MFTENNSKVNLFVRVTRLGDIFCPRAPSNCWNLDDYNVSFASFFSLLFFFLLFFKRMEITRIRLIFLFHRYSFSHPDPTILQLFYDSPDPIVLWDLFLILCGNIFAKWWKFCWILRLAVARLLSMINQHRSSYLRVCVAISDRVRSRYSRGTIVTAHPCFFRRESRHLSLFSLSSFISLEKFMFRYL